MRGLCRKLWSISTYKTFLPSSFIGCSKGISTSVLPHVVTESVIPLHLQFYCTPQQSFDCIYNSKKYLPWLQRGRRGLKQNWFTIKYIKLTTLLWGTLFGYVFPSVPSVNESRKFCLKSIRFDYTSCHQNSTFSTKPFPSLYYYSSMRF